MGVDGISLPFVILTTGLMPLCIIASWEVIQTRVKEYMVAFLALETLMIGTFSALDLVLFYLFFEGGLIPMFLIIGVWGGPRRVYASFKFFLYTLLGSVLMLLAIMAMYWQAEHDRHPDADEVPASRTGMQTWLWLAFFASFAVKMPMWPVHTWLPDAHVEAPTAGSVILAAILLKMGGYGFLRFSVPMFPHASMDLAPLIFALSVIAVIYTSLVALVQEDMKKLIAYSSVAHMGFVTMGIFALTTQGVAGGIFQMISHGIVSAALFLCVGVVYDRMHTREISAYGGLVNNMPLYALVFMLFTLANVGLPGTSGFVGEFLALIGTFKVNIPVATLATIGVILSACYALWLYRKVVFGVIEKPALAGLRDLGRREILVFAPLVFLTILFGIYPKPVLDMSAASVAQLLENYQAATAPKKAAGLPRRGSGEMNARLLLPVLPEIVLVLGAMALLMVGAYRERSVQLVNACAFALLVLAAVIVYALPAGKHVAFGGSFVIDDFARVLKILTLIGSAVTIVLARDYLAAEKQEKFEFSILILLSTTGMLMLISAADLIALYLGLELMSLALYVVAASNRDQRALDRGRPEVFRARRALVRDAALRRLADLRLHRHGQLRRHRAGREAGRHRAHLRPRVPVRGLLLQGLGGAVPHVDARRLRGRADAGHGVLRLRAEDRRDRDVRARADHGVPRDRAAMAADHRVRRDRLDGARVVRGDRPAATSSG